jgi:hypothetical protein
MKAVLQCLYDEGGTESLFMGATEHSKLIARTADFDHWRNPHRPEGFKLADDALFDTKHPLFDKKEMMLSAHCGREREGSDLPTLLLPVHDVYLRHYRFYSLSEFMESRGAFNFSAAGTEVNPCNNVMSLNVNIPQPSFFMQPIYAFNCTPHTNMIAKKWQDH